MKKSDEDVLLDIVSAAQPAHRFAREVEDFEAFSSNELVRSAVLHQLMILGEAVKRLSESFRASHDHVPWTDAAGMRDRLIHGYDAVDVEIVWQAATREVPSFLQQLQPLLPKDSE